MFIFFKKKVRVYRQEISKLFYKHYMDDLYYLIRIESRPCTKPSPPLSSKFPWINRNLTSR